MTNEKVFNLCGTEISTGDDIYDYGLLTALAEIHLKMKNAAVIQSFIIKVKEKAKWMQKFDKQGYPDTSRWIRCLFNLCEEDYMVLDIASSYSNALIAVSREALQCQLGKDTGNVIDLDDQSKDTGFGGFFADQASYEMSYILMEAIAENI